jgi:hypothetical protein
MPMKLYEVELLRTSYVTYVVEALDEGDAEDEAWKLLEKDGTSDKGNAEWELSNVWRYEE